MTTQIIMKRLSRGAFPVDVRQLDLALAQLGFPSAASIWAEVAIDGDWPATAAMGVAEFFDGLGRMPTESEQAINWIARDSLAKALGWMGAEDNRCWPTGGGCVLTRALVSPPSTWTRFDACVANEIIALNRAAKEKQAFLAGGEG